MRDKSLILKQSTKTQEFFGGLLLTAQFVLPLGITQSWNVLIFSLIYVWLAFTIIVYVVDFFTKSWDIKKADVFRDFLLIWIIFPGYAVTTDYIWGTKGVNNE